MSNNKGVLLVFAKSPEPGQVKTRLIPDIGVDAATNLYKELLTRTLNTSVNSIFSEKQLWISGNKEHSFFDSFHKINHFKVMPQTGKDLGERMYKAFNEALNENHHAVLIGCDCPELNISDFQSAVAMLESDKDLVLGPAEDGGYYLIGLKKNHIELFTDVEWGSDTVFSKTISIAEKLNLNIGLLTKRSDIDRVADLQAYETRKTKRVAS